MKQADKSVISAYRSYIMGFSILWITVFHSSLSIQNPILRTIKLLGYGGVDFFLFLSGMGLYVSLRKSSDVLAFYKRRLSRLMPSYLVFLVFWFLYKMRHADLTIAQMIKSFLGNIFMTGWANEIPYQFNWYVQALFWFYLLAPCVYALISGTKRRLRTDGLILLSAVCFSLTLVHHFTLMAVSRIPVFILGMIYADWEKDCSVADRRKAGYCSLVFMVIGFALEIYSMQKCLPYLKPYGLFWYPFILIAPGFCYAFGRVTKMMDGILFFRPVMSLLRIAGTCSFEIYMFHLAFFKIFPKEIGISGNREWLFLIVLSVLSGMIYHYVIAYLTNLITKRLPPRKELSYHGNR